MFSGQGSHAWGFPSHGGKESLTQAPGSGDQHPVKGRDGGRGDSRQRLTGPLGLKAVSGA